MSGQQNMDDVNNANENNQMLNEDLEINQNNE